MKALRLFSLIGSALLLSGTALAVSSSYARAQDGSVFDSQQPSQSDIDTSPDAKKPPLTISGAWSGTLEDNLAGEGTLNADFTEAPNGQLSGNWSFTFESGTDTGTIVGKATATKVKIAFVFTPKAPYIHCKFSVTDAHASDTDIAGKYHFTACGPLTHKEHGTLEISPETEISPE
jgi:hypothetical protein